MIPKAELKAKYDELDRHVNLIYKYNPSLRNIEDNVKVLQNLGLDEKHIMEVIAKGSTYVSTSIINPQTGDEMAIYVEEITVKQDDAGQYGVYIGAVPYQSFFSKALMTKDKLEKLSQDYPEVKTVYEENQKLKALLTQLKRKP